MWAVNDDKLQMAEGDYGLTLPITIDGPELTDSDIIRLTIRRTRNSNAIIVREMVPVDNTVNFTVTADETLRLPVGVYSYSLDWYRNGIFMCNVIPMSSIKVVDKV